MGSSLEIIVWKNQTKAHNFLWRFGIFFKELFFKEYCDDIEIVPKTMNIDFCENIDIKYDYDYNYLRNLLDNYVYFVEELLLAKKKLNL